jgi:hypothetical protein
MATLTAPRIRIPVSTPAKSVVRAVPKRRRQITPQAGRALEILGHAVDYLTDEFMESGGALAASNPELEAVQLLMALNRQVYFECPEMPSFGERCHALFARFHLVSPVR